MEADVKWQLRFIVNVSYGILIFFNIVGFLVEIQALYVVNMRASIFRIRYATGGGHQMRYGALWFEEGEEGSKIMNNLLIVLEKNCRNCSSATKSSWSQVHRLAWQPWLGASLTQKQRPSRAGGKRLPDEGCL